ncbi:translation initiation factor eIF-2B subunit epsilon-like [Pollicipes pollicipes]|uniref:translation initiation factor eIF-2B subunit epsilon-like n=1 Tax=Pollicipes pollicipes TaxID=41117 RepID=UPI001884B81D|nr:translation initiation factor eIF-2B subunit epsilon-like [Pollicipes pollicipes]
MSSKKNQTNALKAEDVVQAVLLADNFTENIAPYSLNSPLGLVLLVNVPLLGYALEYLEAVGIHECFIYLCKSPDEVKKYISASRWLDGSNPMVIHIQTAEDCLSLGDVMRDLDAKALIQSDFLLMSVDCITNVDIVPIIREHSARRKADDRGSVMTLLYREASPRHPARHWDAQVLLAADQETGRVVHHQRLAAGQRGKVTLPLHIFQAASAVEVRYDLLDPGISICSPNVPQLFSDNFDFQTRDHFVKGIIVNEEILGSTIYYKCLSADYAAQISGLNALVTVTRDVMDRWAYPVVPENRGHTSHIRCIQRNVYRHRTATVGRDSRLEESVALADGVIVGLRCRLLRAVVGPGCRLGDDVVLEDAVLDAGCRLGDRTVVCAVPRELVGDSGRGFVYAAVPYQQCRLTRCRTGSAA